MSRLHALVAMLSLVAAVALLVSPVSSSAAPSVTGPEGDPPFLFPFEGAPGPSTWTVGQLYGNTTGAYFLGDVWYAAGQGLHFGIDVIAPCGTPIISIGDGEVVQADWTARGSGPHNLIVRHPAEGIAVLYGHLLERPDYSPGDPVARGDVIALSGDPDNTCRSRPHLHLELRSLDYRTAYNPVRWIDADWDALMLFGSFSDVAFARDLDQPMRWVTPYDQPDVQFGGAIVNEYPRVWPAQRSQTACVLGGC